jgi:hypothetical protein
MDWENERYVRVYTRDTIDWVALGWEAQSLFLLLIRKVDRSGVLEVGKHGARGVAGLIGMPVEVVERALAVLTADGCVTICDGCLLMPNFIEAQEAKQSDKQRQKECHDKRRKGAMSHLVTEPSRIVTDSHDQSHPVTSGHTVSLQPSLAVPTKPSEQNSGARARSNPPANEPGKPSPSNVVQMFLSTRARVIGGSVGVEKPFSQAQQGEIEKAERWLSTMSAEDARDIEPAIRLACEHVRDGVEGWTHGSITKTGFLFGAIVTNWRDLREELHGCAPKVAKPRTVDRPHEQPKTWKIVER